MTWLHEEEWMDEVEGIIVLFVLKDKKMKVKRFKDKVCKRCEWFSRWKSKITILLFWSKLI